MCRHAQDDSSEEGKTESFFKRRRRSRSSSEMCFWFQGPEFIQFLQQDYLPSLQVSPDIIQVNVWRTITDVETSQNILVRSSGKNDGRLTHWSPPIIDQWTLDQIVLHLLLQHLVNFVAGILSGDSTAGCQSPEELHQGKNVFKYGRQLGPIYFFRSGTNCLPHSSGC